MKYITKNMIILGVVFSLCGLSACAADVDGIGETEKAKDPNFQGPDLTSEGERCETDDDCPDSLIWVQCPDRSMIKTERRYYTCQRRRIEKFCEHLGTITIDNTCENQE